MKLISTNKYYSEIYIEVAIAPFILTLKINVLAFSIIRDFF